MDKHQCRKRFGQNFLQDNAVIWQIAAAISAKPSDHIIEIGPGLGALTAQLINKPAKYDAIELDRDLIPKLNNKFNHSQNFTLHQADILKFDLSSVIPPNTKARIIGNLPYNISTPLLFHLINFIDNIYDMHFMLQHEVAARIAADIGNKSYGKLSVMLQYYCEIEYLFAVPPSAFIPAPKVNSALVKLIPKQNNDIAVVDVKLLQEITTLAFNQRRKTIQNSLKTKLGKEDFIKLNIDPSLRPEQLSVDNYLAISNYLSGKQ